MCYIFFSSVFCFFHHVPCRIFAMKSAMQVLRDVFFSSVFCFFHHLPCKKSICQWLSAMLACTVQISESFSFLSSSPRVHGCIATEIEIMSTFFFLYVPFSQRFPKCIGVYLAVSCYIIFIIIVCYFVLSFQVYVMNDQCENVEPLNWDLHMTMA